MPLPVNDPIHFEDSLDLQKAIDLAVKEKTIVSFPCQLSNNEIREADVNWKECKFHKTHRESDIVCICLSSIQDEIFG